MGFARRDAVGPCAKQCRVAQPSKPTPHAQERLLQDVICTSPAAEQAKQITAKRRLDRDNERLESRHITRLGAQDEADFIGLAHFSSRFAL